MDIDKLTIGELKQLTALLGTKDNGSHPWQIGKCYVIRTVTMMNYGKLVAVHGQELVLEDAAWIADSGRFHDFLKDPNKCNEMEPFTAPIIVGRGSIIDAQEINPMKVSQK